MSDEKSKPDPMDPARWPDASTLTLEQRLRIRDGMIERAILDIAGHVPPSFLALMIGMRQQLADLAAHAIGAEKFSTKATDALLSMGDLLQQHHEAIAEVAESVREDEDQYGLFRQDDEDDEEDNADG